jgi:hypothetical protein
MVSGGDVRAQVTRESEHRSRLAVPAFAGGVLYLLSAIIIQATVRGAPTVGVLQGLSPALKGVANPAVSPRASEVKFISHRAFPLIAGSVLAALAIAALVLSLLLLFYAARFRRPESWPAARPLALAGGIVLAVLSIGNQIAKAIETHRFGVGHDFTNHAVDHALTKSSVYLPFDYLGLLAGIALAAGTIAIALNAMRVGLLPRWMGFLGMFTGILIFFAREGAFLQVVPAFWMVMLGILFAGRWPNGDPPAWASGEARPWPSQAQARAARAPARTRGDGDGAEPAAGAGASEEPDATPAPAKPPGASSARRRRRKRGARR